MKKILSLALAILMLLMLCSCGGKDPSITALAEYPASPSLKDAEKFVKSCGYDVTGTTDRSVSFSHGDWTGLAMTQGVSLSYNTIGKSEAEFDAAIEAVRSELEALCGKAYASNTSQMPPITTEFYQYGNKVIAITIIPGTVKSLSISIQYAG